ncbi:hypothetical protein TCON_2208 [Astathelohania contejeani]|uniref:Uncharacterized protein n=1 Tax=Astathelohania contejeani TaxID=164912 RepID=A0ABQ7HWM7_9MICR|nr:hypothetical protein TCON_2208 [Thelohania contejeani]
MKFYRYIFYIINIIKCVQLSYNKENNTLLNTKPKQNDKYIDNIEMYGQLNKNLINENTAYAIIKSVLKIIIKSLYDPRIPLYSWFDIKSVRIVNKKIKFIEKPNSYINRKDYIADVSQYKRCPYQYTYHQHIYLKAYIKNQIKNLIEDLVKYAPKLYILYEIIKSHYSFCSCVVYDLMIEIITLTKFPKNWYKNFSIIIYKTHIFVNQNDFHILYDKENIIKNVYLLLYDKNYNYIYISKNETYILSPQRRYEVINSLSVGFKSNENLKR